MGGDAKLIPLRASDNGDGTYSLAVNGSSQGTQVTLTNQSGSITTGGTAQTAIAANGARRGFEIQNLSSGDLWINTLATAVQDQPSMRIAPGQLYETPAHRVPTGAVSIIGATTGQKFYAREW